MTSAALQRPELETPNVDTSPTSVGVQRLPRKVFGGLILGKAHPEFDLSSRSMHTGHVSYSIRGNERKPGIFEVLRRGPGQWQMGYRDPILVNEGDMVMVTLRDTSNWITIDGVDYCLFNWQSCMARLTPSKTETIQKFDNCQMCATLRIDTNNAAALCPICMHTDRLINSTPAWDIETLQNYVLVEHNMREFANWVLPPTLRENKMHLDAIIGTEGLRSDNEKRNRFPVLYSKVLQKGPGKRYPRFHDTLGGAVELVDEQCEADVGSMIGYVSTMAHCEVNYYGKDYRFLHARNAYMQLDGPEDECGSPSSLSS